jgi:VanZ family protein
MLLIFVASADTDSGARSSRWLEPFLRWLWPEIGAEERGQWIFWARKGVHVFAFGTLAALFWRMWSTLQPHRTYRWTATVAWTCTVLYAVIDEVHQQFVPSRVGSPVDVAIDAAGATLAVGMLVLYRRLRRTGAAK